jgi:hypothetical protein
MPPPAKQELLQRSSLLKETVQLLTPDDRNELRRIWPGLLEACEAMIAGLPEKGPPT